MLTLGQGCRVRVTPRGRPSAIPLPGGPESARRVGGVASAPRQPCRGRRQRGRPLGQLGPPGLAGLLGALHPLPACVPVRSRPQGPVLGARLCPPLTRAGPGASSPQLCSVGLYPPRGDSGAGWGGRQRRWAGMQLRAPLLQRQWGTIAREREGLPPAPPSVTRAWVTVDAAWGPSRGAVAAPRDQESLAPTHVAPLTTASWRVR